MNSRLLFFNRNRIDLFPEPEPFEFPPEPKATPIAHPFVVREMRVQRSQTGEVIKELDPKLWPDYGLEAVR